MACPGAIVAGLNRTAQAPTLPVTTFRIELEPTSFGDRKEYEYEPGDEICGKLILSNYKNFQCLGIFISLAGDVEVGYVSGNTMRTKYENLLSDTWTTVYFVGCSEEAAPKGSKSPNRESVTVVKSNHVYLFSIPIRKLLQFPGSFTGPHGNISYRVAACIETGTIGNAKGTHQPIKIKSYFNLRSVPITLKPVTIEGQINKYMLSKKIGLKFTFSVPRTGYIAGEQIPFTLTLLNPYQRRITKAFVGLSKKVSFVSEFTSKACKSCVQYLDCPDPESRFIMTEAQWADSITIPQDAYPTISEIIIQHSYTLRVEIYVDGDASPILQGDIPITIATIREMPCEGGPVARSLTEMPKPKYRRTGSVYSLPPAYSQLSSRSASVASFETLPPFFDDVNPIDDIDESEET